MNIQKFLAKLIEAGREIIEPEFNRRSWHGPTPQKRVRHGTTNHSKGESRVRRKMAARSRRINRGK